VTNKQARIPNLEVRQKHIINVQVACMQLEDWTCELDHLTLQLEAEIQRQPHGVKRQRQQETIK
jgi:hypothetical protein